MAGVYDYGIPLEDFEVVIRLNGLYEFLIRFYNRRFLQ
jgi:hypothetical protein